MLKKLFCIFSTICLGNFKTPEFQSESQNDLYNNPLLSTLTSGPVLSGIVLTSNNASPTVYFNFSINVVLILFLEVFLLALKKTWIGSGLEDNHGSFEFQKINLLVLPFFLMNQSLRHCLQEFPLIFKI